MSFASVSKAIGGAVAGAVAGGVATPLGLPLIIPADVEMPWWGYIVAAVVGAVIGYAGPWIAPRNQPSRS